MSKKPQIYHGEWWVPAVADRDTRMISPHPEEMMGLESRHMGTLTYYEDEESTLELYLVPSNFHAHYDHSNDVMWGKDANGNIFTLFNVTMIDKQSPDFTNTKFTVGLILIGEHVLSIEEAWSKKCCVHFPYLNNWLFYETKQYITPSLNNEYHLDASIRGIKLIETEVEKGIVWRLYHGMQVAESIEGITIKKTPYLIIESSEPISIYSYLMQIAEFEQFLSIALCGEQNSSEIKFIGSDSKRSCKLLLKRESSFNPFFISLIKFVELKDRLPSMLNTWHANFEKIAPISSYLIDSFQKKNRFDVPDFLIIAQALDGYHKRFVNKKVGGDVRQYEKQVEVLLNHFKDVKAIQECRIKPAVLKDSRHKYSHLYPDEEESLAVEGEDLYWLTEKCKVLLTCCILNMLGLTNEEINLCCEHSPISQIVDSLPPEFD